MSKAIVNLTTKEYFIYSNEKDKIKKLNKLTVHSSGTKLLTFLLQLYDKNITCDNCGECYWNKSDDIVDNIDIDTLYKNLDNGLYKSFDEVPKHLVE